MPEIEYIKKSRDDLDIIKPLWQKLNDHHKAVARYQKKHFATFTFDMRNQQLLKKSQGGALHIDLAQDSKTGKYVGYCVSTVNFEKQGEIESIYVEEGYRGYGIGDQLMIRALDWLEIMSAKRRILGVAEGNESVFGFYRRYNFYPRMTILEQKLDKSE